MYSGIFHFTRRAPPNFACKASAVIFRNKRRALQFSGSHNSLFIFHLFRKYQTPALFNTEEFAMEGKVTVWVSACVFTRLIRIMKILHQLQSVLQSYVLSFLCVFWGLTLGLLIVPEISNNLNTKRD